MACCTTKDAAIRGFTEASSREPPELLGLLRLRYLGPHGIRARGPVTGRFYTFEPRRPDTEVDTRDAEFLLRNPVFRRA